MKTKKTKIMVFGTFDGLHKGHLDFFKQARKLAPKSFLIVSVARDKNVFEIKKMHPFLNEKERTILVKKCGLVDRVVLAGLKNHIPHILKEKPGIIALGYDQKAYIDKQGSRTRVISHTASESKSHQGNPYVNNLKKDL
ncbi:MAG: adenylyltransferase/cytidyltransferase family protein, partial [Patescibacteria group bacterium]